MHGREVGDYRRFYSWPTRSTDCPGWWIGSAEPSVRVLDAPPGSADLLRAAGVPERSRDSSAENPCSYPLISSFTLKPRKREVALRFRVLFVLRLGLILAEQVLVRRPMRSVPPHLAVLGDGRDPIRAIPERLAIF
jgi:hypothetical protein